MGVDGSQAVAKQSLCDGGSRIRRQDSQSFHSQPTILDFLSNINPNPSQPLQSPPSALPTFLQKRAAQITYKISDQYQIQLFYYSPLQERMHTPTPQVLRFNPSQAYDTHHTSADEQSSLRIRSQKHEKNEMAGGVGRPARWSPCDDGAEVPSCEDRNSHREKQARRKERSAESDYQINVVESKQGIQHTGSIRPLKPISGRQMVKELRVESRHRIRTDIFVSSGDCQHDLSENSNELPLTSIYRPKSIKCYKEWQDSDDLNELITRKKGILPTKSYVKERQESLELSSDEDFLEPCRKCRQMGESYSKLQNQNKELQMRLTALQEQLGRSIKMGGSEQYQSSANFNDEISSSISLQLFEPSLHSLLFQQLKETGKTIKKYLEAKGKEEEDSFTEEEVRIYEELTKNLQNLGKEMMVSSEGSEKFAFLHDRYKGIIDKLKRYYCDRLQRLESDFKNAMTIISKKPQDRKSEQGELSFEQQFDTHPRKLHKAKTYIDKEQLLQSIQIEQLKQKINKLQNNLQRDKRRTDNIEKYARKLMEKYNVDVSRLAKERNSYMQALKKSTWEFSAFMSSLVKKTITFQFFQSEFFKKIALRVFEVSNSIPFEDNDEQNLFAPENEEQLLEMIERIRRFYFRMQQYNARKARQQAIYKRNVVLFFKDLVETEKVSLRVLLQLIKKYKDLDFQYIKNYITAIREKRGKTDDRKASPLRRRNARANTESITKANFELSDEADRE